MRTTWSPEILLVEDDPADIYLIERAIADSRPQSRVWLATTGSQARAFLRHAPPSFVPAPSLALILLDLTLPGCDGHALLAEVRGLTRYDRTPVVILSGSPRAVEEPRCLQLGASAYVQKSRDFTAYFASIQAILRDWLGGEGAPREGRADGGLSSKVPQKACPFFLGQHRE